MKFALKNKNGERYFNVRPAVLAYAFFAVGIWTATLVLWNNAARIAITATMVVCCSVAACLKKKGIAFLCALFVLGETLFFGIADVYESKSFEVEDAVITARIVSDYEQDDSRFHYKADSVVVNGKKLKGKMIVSYSDGDLPLGAVVRFTADTKTRKFSTHWSAINSYRKKEWYSAKTDSVEVLTVQDVPLYDKIRYKVKANLYVTLRSDTADIIVPLLIGDTGVINKNLKADMSAAGLSHLFAVSGLHVGFLAALINLILKRLKTSYTANVLITNAVLLFYAGLCCWSSSVLRAIIMFDVYALSKLSGRKSDPASSLALSGIIVLALFPEDILRVGYHMSMLAVCGLVFYAMGRKEKKQNVFKRTLKTSLAVNVPMFPVICSAFGGISLFGLASNLLILPIASFMYIIAFINVLLVLIMPFLRPTLYVSAMAVLPIKLIVTIVGQLNFGVLNLPPFGYAMALYFVCIVAGSRFINAPKKIKRSVSATSLVLSFALAVIQI